MRNTRWLNPSQPQTLVNACILMYISAALDLLFGGLFVPLGLLLIAGKVGAGWGIANERKWGYGLGIGVAVLALIPVLVYLGSGGHITVGVLIGNAFDILLLVLLLHTQSREYQRIWFR